MQVNLVFLKKDGSTSSFELPSTVTSIGRRQDCDFCIPLTVVSRRHCEINQDAGKITVRDLKSRNGTFINDQAIEEKIVKAGDVLKIGPVQFVVQVDGKPDAFQPYLSQTDTAGAAAAAAQAQGDESTPQPSEAPAASAESSTPEPAAVDYSEQNMEAIGEPELSGSQTELQSDFLGDFDLDEEFEL